MKEINVSGRIIYQKLLLVLQRKIPASPEPMPAPRSPAKHHSHGPLTLHNMPSQPLIVLPLLVTLFQPTLSVEASWSTRGHTGTQNPRGSLTRPDTKPVPRTPASKLQWKRHSLPKTTLPSEVQPLTQAQTLYWNTIYLGQKTREKTENKEQHLFKKDKLRNRHLDLQLPKVQMLRCRVRADLTAARALCHRQSSVISVLLLQQTLNIHSNTGVAQGNNFQTKFIKVMEVLKEEKKLCCPNI